ncbi:MAG: (d)CMP kinase [Candidatus Methylomirabilales bacterium]
MGSKELRAKSKEPRAKGSPLSALCSRRGLIIAIDGPVAAGKSTAARLLAKRLGYRYIDSGAMYRALAWKALTKGLDLQDEAALARLAQTTRIEFMGEAEALRVLVDGFDVTEAIRDPTIDEASSLVSSYGGVRRRMVLLQRRLAQRGGVVMEGRDIGTVVFPDADLKFYLRARLSVRARRRFFELKLKGKRATFRDVLKEVKSRDARDTSRRLSPLQQAEDAIPINSSLLTVEEVVQRMWEEVRRRLKEQGQG